MTRIYDATPLDVPAIVACMRVMHAESRTHSKFEFKEDDVDFILREVLAHKDPNRQFLKIAKTDDGTVVGVVGAEVVDDLWTNSTVTSAHLIYVMPTHRGRLGNELMAEYLAWAKRNADRIEAWVTSGILVDRGGKFMEAHGLEPRGAVYGMEF